MGTDLHLQPTEGKLVTKSKASNPIRAVEVVSKTKDKDFSGYFVQLAYSYGTHDCRAFLDISFNDIDMVVDALLEHQAARKGRLLQGVTIGEVEERHAKYRAAFMERRGK